jgi:hypothetical protein
LVFLAESVVEPSGEFAEQQRCGFRGVIGVAVHHPIALATILPVYGTAGRTRVFVTRKQPSDDARAQSDGEPLCQQHERRE